jgi:hypothetical protein
VRYGPAVALTTILGLAALVDVAAQERVIERAFPHGGTIVLDLSAGDYEIIGSRDNRIRVEWHTRRDNDARVRVRADVNARRATILTDGPTRDFTVRIELPQRSNLVARLSAGELDIRGIEGSKDVAARAGDIDIDVGDRDSYRRVDASVKVGGLRAYPFRVEKGGLFRTLYWTGKGKYDLRANLTVGQVTLRD